RDCTGVRCLDCASSPRIRAGSRPAPRSTIVVTHRCCASMRDMTRDPRMKAIDPEMLADVLRHALDGVVVVEGDDARVVYANATLAAMMRRPEGWPLGRPLQELEQDTTVETPRPAGTGVRCRLRAADGTVTECDRWEFVLQHGRRALFYRFA